MLKGFVVAYIGLLSSAIAAPLSSTFALPRSLTLRALLGPCVVPASSRTASGACVDPKDGLGTESTVQVNGPPADITVSEEDVPLPFVSGKAPLDPLESASDSSRNASANHEDHGSVPRPVLRPLPVGSNPAEGGVVVGGETT
ncbi:hypothetical protein MMC26_000412 [Xylographa opegraphella]|nr:hypothetical protein [Xylographa opegraphella]